MRALHHRLAQAALFGLVRLMVGAYRNGPLPTGSVQIFFANHTSHLDTLTLLAALPKEIRARTRPVAARDCWRTMNRPETGTWKAFRSWSSCIGVYSDFLP